MPYWSKAVTVTLKVTPTVGAKVEGVSVKLARVEAPTVAALLMALGKLQLL